MTDHQFYICWTEIPNYTDPAAYISDMALSSIWEGSGTPDERTEQLRRMWDVAHMSMRDLRAASGLSQIRYGERYCIPRRSIEQWDTGVRTPPDYVKIMIAKSLGLL